MKQSHFSEEQIIGVLKQGEAGISGDSSPVDDQFVRRLMDSSGNMTAYSRKLDHRQS